MTYTPAALRRDVIERAGDRCEYCLLPAGVAFFPHEVDDGYLDSLVADAHRLAELHDELLPPESFGERGFGARIEPYRSMVAPGAKMNEE